MREVVISQDEIKEAVKKCAQELENKFKDSKDIPIFIGVLKGSLPFMMDLLKAYSLPCIEDYIQVSSYDGTESTGVIHLKKDVSENIKNKDIVIIEDIVDTGLTLSYLKQYLKVKYQPRSITIVTFIDKKPLRRAPLDPDIVGVTITKNKFLVGYGLDYYEICRNIDYVFVPSKEDLDNWDKILKENSKEE